MTTTNVYEIKPQQNLRNKVSLVLSKNSLRQLENNVKTHVGDTLRSSSWVQEIANAKAEAADAISVAPVECQRFPSAIEMACQESLKIDFQQLDGLGSRSKLFIILSVEKLRKAFSIYASGSFRRDEARSKYPQLELLIPGSFAPDEAGVEVELDWSEVDGVPQMTLLLCTAFAGDCTAWISKPLVKSMSKLVAKLNESIVTNAARSS
jgi:hypothetical protein